MSNIPFDRPLTNMIKFDPANFPPVQLQLPPILQNLIPITAAHLLNQAMEKSGNNVARMSTLNHLVVNNYQNENYSAMVNLALRIAIRKAFQQNAPGDVKNFIGQGVDDALNYLSSSLIVANPQMRIMISNDAARAADQNYSIFLKVKDELNNLNLTIYNQAPQQPQQQNFAAPNTSMTVAPLFGNYSHSYANVHQPDPNAGASSFGGQWGSNNQPQQPHQQQQLNPLKQESWFTNSTLSNQTQQVQPGAQSIPIVDFQQLAGNQITTNIVPPQIVAPNLISTTSIVTCKGENEMDINNHALPYFGSTDLLVDLSGRRSDLQLEALQLSREGRRHENSTDPILLERSILIDTNLDSAIFTASVSKAQNLHGGHQNQIYRQFLKILSPTACTPAAKVAQSIFTAAHTLQNLPDLFRTYLKAIRDPSNPQEDEQQALNFYCFLDKKICASVNEFLKYNLRVTVKMNSFAEDFSELEKHLKTKYGDNYHQALCAWSSKFFDQIRNGYTKESEEFLSEFFSEESPTSFGYFPTFQSITLLGLTEKELSYKVDSNGSLIDPKITNVLDSLAQGLYRNKKDLCYNTSKDWLVTADDVRFRLAEDALNPGKFYIFPVN